MKYSATGGIYVPKKARNFHSGKKLPHDCHWKLSIKPKDNQMKLLREALFKKLLS